MFYLSIARSRGGENREEWGFNPKVKVLREKFQLAKDEGEGSKLKSKVNVFHEKFQSGEWV